MITYVHVFNTLAERYLDGRLVTWTDLVTGDRVPWTSAVRA